MNRHRLVGIGAALAGVFVLFGLLAAGSIRHPVAAAEGTHPAEFVAITVGLVLVTVGVVTVLATYVEH